jgi:hypothetical protein
MNKFKLEFETKADAKLFMKFAPATYKTSKLVINNNYRIDLYKNILEVETELTENEFRNLFNL